jgi:hypothetical protein
MLFNASWSKIAEKHEHLCGECFFERANACKVRITQVDLRPCPFNVMLSPHDWFNFFAKGPFLIGSTLRPSRMLSRMQLQMAG